MSDNYNSLITYTKSNPLENIEPGDVVMLDASNLKITRAYYNNNKFIYSRFVIGICVQSYNEGDISQIIDGNKAKDYERIVLNGGNAEQIQTIIISGQGANENPKSIVKIACKGIAKVNVCDSVSEGDKLTISSYPGKAKKYDYRQTDNLTRPIGKVIQSIKDENYVYVLLDIE